MKSIISKTMMPVVIATSLFSFSLKPGGEGFEIYLNNKVLVQRYGNDINTVNNLQLNQSGSNDKLTIKYHHCGRVGKNRMVTIKDLQNNVLKAFRFADVATPVAAMTIPVKEIPGLNKENSNTVKLYYASSELPNGRLLTTIH